MTRLSFILPGMIFILIIIIPFSYARGQEDFKACFAEEDAAEEDFAEENFIDGSVDWKKIRVLDLKTAEKIAITDNLSLAAAKARVYQALERVAQAKSFWWPKVDVNSFASRVSFSDNEYARALSAGRAVDPKAKINDPEDIYNINITAGWVVFNGFERWFSTAYARSGAEESRKALMDARRLLISSLGFSYHNAQLARENINIARADEIFNRISERCFKFQGSG